MAELITNLGNVITGAVGWMGDFGNAIVASPLLLVGVGLGLVSGVAALFSSVFHSRG